MTCKNELILANLIANKVESNADLDVLTFVHIDGDGQVVKETRTYQQLWNNAQRIASGLNAQGLKPGQSFALLMQNHPEFVETMIAASITGTVFVPIDPRTQGLRLKYMLEFAQCRGVVCTDYTLDNLFAVKAQLPQIDWVFRLNSGIQLTANKDTVSLDEILNTKVTDLPILSTDPDAPMQMLYTSGTTGDPKAILSPHRRFGEAINLGAFLGLQEGDRPYSGLSLTHANAQIITLGCSLKMGLRAVISRKFTKSKLWDITREFGCTVFNLLGGMTTAVYSEPNKPNDNDNPVRYVISAGMPKAIWSDFSQRFNVEIFEFYGAAEGGLTINPMGQGPIGSIGKAPPTLEVRIVDEEDNECPRGIPGEIVFRHSDGSAPHVEYFNNEVATAEKVKNGWLRMGDIGHMDEQGWLFFHYRKGGGLRRNGDFINPACIEKVVAEDPQISDVYVYGVPAASGAPGEKDIVAAVVTLHSNDFNTAQLYANCRKHLEVNSMPSYIQIVDEIPKTASEKPQERFLIELFDTQSERVFSFN